MFFPNKVGLLLCLPIFFPIFCIFGNLNVNASLQQVSFYSWLRCSGGEKVTYFNTQDILNSTWVANASSVRVIGLWEVTMEIVLEGYSNTVSIFSSKAQPPRGNCFDKETGWDVPDPKNYRFVSVNRTGPSDMTTSQIIFYTAEGFKGREYVFDRNETEKFPTGPIQFKSEIMFSSDPWTVYPEANFMGKPMFFSTGSSNPPKDFFKLNSSVTGYVGSVKRGYHGLNAAGCTTAVNIILLHGIFLKFVINLL